VRRRLLVVLADLLTVLGFVLLGRRSHGEGPALTGTVATAWPFLTGAGLGEVALIVARRPAESPAAGVVVAVGAVAGGMILRRLTGGGTPASFVVVAAAFLALFLVGWRVGARLLAGRRAGP
jgi:DUF3054 family protein